MKFLRVIKCISFIVFILALALCAVGHGFVLCEMNIFEKDADVKYSMTEIKEELKDYNDVIKGLFSKEDKEESKEENEATASVPNVLISSSADATADEATAIDATPVEPAVEPEKEAAPETGYTLEGKNEYIASVMKYGCASAPFGWITNNIAALNGSSINISLFVAYTALILSFILHFISKKEKGFYGYILMLIGFVFFFAIVALGYYFSEFIISFFTGFLTGEADDWSLYRAAFSIFCFVLGALIGLPIYRCGVRQIANKHMKKLNSGLMRKIEKQRAARQRASRE